MARPTHPSSWGAAAANWTRPQPTMIPYGFYQPQPYHPAAYAAVAAVNPSGGPPVTSGTLPCPSGPASASNQPNPLKRPHPDSAVEAAGSKDHHILWMRAYDKPIPEFLKSKCKPLYCEVCSVNLNSVIQAKMHYEGKLHEKKIRASLVTWAKENNTVPPRKALPSTINPNASTPALNGPSVAQQPRYDMQFYDPRQDLYCGPCDTSFTSHAHAQQHFSGRNHKRVMSGLAPLKAGYFNTRTGKWQRQPPQETEAASGENGESSGTEPPTPANAGNGSDLAFPPPSHAPLPPPPPPPPPAPPGQESNSNNAVEGSALGPKYYCHVCGVNATSQAQLDMHLNGKNHKTKYDKMYNVQMYDAYHHSMPQPAQMPMQLPMPVSSSKPEMESNQQPSKQKNSKKDYSIYRTPSGEYYCGLCDLRVNSENQFVQHIASRKHKLKESSAKGKKSKTKK